MKLRSLAIASTFALTTFTAGCMGLINRGPEESATITVVNEVDPPMTMTIQVRRDNDDDDLGTVSGGNEREFTYTSRNLRGTYQLVARESAGGGMVSREFTLFSGARVRWEIKTNTLSTSQAR